MPITRSATATANSAGCASPHVRAASARGDRRALAWLAQMMTAAASARPASPGWLAGTDHDADTRAVLWDAVPATVLPRSGTCAACLAAARSEASQLAWIARSSDRRRPDRRLLLCAGHLSDLIVLAGQRETGSLLAWQAWSLAAALTWPVSPPRRGPAGWLRSRRRHSAGLGACPVCLAGEPLPTSYGEDLYREVFGAAGPAPA